MDNLFILTLLIGVVVLAFFIAPALIGYFVYRHASKHPIGQPLQWALIAALTPLYLGLAIYLFKIDQIDTKIYEENELNKRT
jgi:putative effector of murein hydrolase